MLRTLSVSSRWSDRKAKVEPYVWTLPAAAFLVLFVAFPVAFSVRLSLFNWSGETPINAMTWTGLSNYRALPHDPIFRTALKNTVIFALSTTAGITLLAFFLGFALWYRAPRWAGYARTFILYPATLSGVIVAIAWAHLFAFDGLINGLIGALTRSTPTILWLANVKWTFWVVVWVEIWWQVGVSVVLYLAAMGGISRDVLDRARVDGATSFQLARRVAEPMIRPTSSLILLLNFINGLQAFTIIYVLTGGGPVHSTEVVATYSYWLAFGLFGPSEFGYAAAATNIAVVILLVVS